MADIDKVLAEELPPESANLAAETPPAIWPRPSPYEHLKPTQFQPGQSGNPSGLAATPGRYTVRRAIREELTIANAKALAKTAVAEAIAGNPRWAEYVRDTDEGKPGVRMDANEWAPAEAAVFQQMMALRAASLVGQPQIEEPAE